MAEPVIRSKVIEEIKLIPEDKLMELYDFVHYFRLGLENNKTTANQIMKFAGCWKDMTEEAFREFIEEIGQRRRQAFSKRH